MIERRLSALLLTVALLFFPMVRLVILNVQLHDLCPLKRFLVPNSLSFATVYLY